MIERYFEKIINHFGIWHTVQIALISFSVILLITIFSQFFISIYTGQIDGQTENASEFATNENISVLPDENKDKKGEAIAYRPGMFRPATGLQDKPLANKTIERIKEQLKLQCVMEMNGQPVAYINIQGVGLKKCYVGDNVNDLFTVLDINKQNKSVGISIVEHKVTLHL
ncbi:MAG: hypothetical protein ACYS9Y_08575 [Planctomycetota bacterium]|jgi:hypothetical protein